MPANLWRSPRLALWQWRGWDLLPMGWMSTGKHQSCSRVPGSAWTDPVLALREVWESEAPKNCPGTSKNQCQEVWDFQLLNIVIYNKNLKWIYMLFSLTILRSNFWKWVKRFDHQDFQILELGSPETSWFWQLVQALQWPLQLRAAGWSGCVAEMLMRP